MEFLAPPPLKFIVLLVKFCLFHGMKNNDFVLNLVHEDIEKAGGIFLRPLKRRFGRNYRNLERSVSVLNAVLNFCGRPIWNDISALVLAGQYTGGNIEIIKNDAKGLVGLLIVK